MPRLPLLLCASLLAGGCVVGDAPPEDGGLGAPTFEPEAPGEPADGSVPAASGDDGGEGPDRDGDEADPAGDAGTSAGATGGAERDGADPDRTAPADGETDDAPPADPPTESTGGEEPASDPDPAPGDGDGAEGGPGRTLRARLTDPRGDTSGTRLTPPPRHADLVGGVLARTADGYRLAIGLDGGAPEAARDGDHTMNVASFYDLTGDGHVDVEVWANLADGGWDTARYDNRSGDAAFSDDDEVAVAVEDDRLVLRFPLGVLDGAERLRWAVASEWGRYEELGGPTSVRDEMPDDGRPARFPG